MYSVKSRIFILFICCVLVYLPAQMTLVQAQSKRGTSPQTTAKSAVAKEVAPPKLEKLAFETTEVDDQGKLKNRHKAEVPYYVEDLGNNIKLEMVKIPSGTFLMGSNEAEYKRFKQEIERYCDGCDGANTAKLELPQHKVSVDSFFIGKIEISQAQYKTLMRINPSNFKQNDLPVENVSWNEASQFCKLLSQKTGREYRLPTEAEWEYAARAGGTTDFGFGDTINAELVNYDSTSPYGKAEKGKYRETTLAGGTLGLANAFGLYDMHGNVYEWCLDTWHEDYQGAPTDGSAWLTGGDKTRRVLRGGAWDVSAFNCRSAYRISDFPDKRGIGPSLGFRVVAKIPDTSSVGAK